MIPIHQVHSPLFRLKRCRDFLVTDRQIAESLPKKQQLGNLVKGCHGNHWLRVLISETGHFSLIKGMVNDMDLHLHFSFILLL